MKKNFLTFTFVFALIFSIGVMATNHVYAAESSEAASSQLQSAAQTSGGQFSDLTWVLDENGKLTISGNGAMPDFTSDKIPWRDVKDSITKIVIEDGVTSIGNCAFYNCTNTTSVYIPDTVTKIGEKPFYSCRQIKTMYIPSSVDYIAGSSSKSAAFFGTYSGLQLYLGCSQSQINYWGSCWNDYALNWALSGINYNMDRASYEYFTGDTLDGSSSETDSKISLSKGVLTISEGINSIPKAYFSGNDEIESVVLPEGMKSIGESAFSNCKNLKSIQIPSTLTSIGTSAFYGCTNLQKVAVEDLGAYLKISVSNVTANPFYVNDLDHYLVLNGEKMTKLQIPGTVKTIPSYAFKNCKSLTSVILESGVTYIKNNVFEGCSGLKDVYLPNTLGRIDYAAFKNCTALRSLFLPVNLLKIKTTNLYGVAQDSPFIGCDKSLVLYAAVAEPEAGWADNFNYYTSEGDTLTVIYDCRRDSDNVIEDSSKEDSSTENSSIGDKTKSQSSDSNSSNGNSSTENSSTENSSTGQNSGSTSTGSESKSTGSTSTGSESKSAGSTSTGSGSISTGSESKSTGSTSTGSTTSSQTSGKNNSVVNKCASGHAWGSWVVSKEPTVFKKGSRKHTCTRCHTTESEKISKLKPTITLSKKKVKLKLNKKTKYRLKVSGLAAGDYVVSYSSSKKSVAKVTSKGKIKAKKRGKAVITVKLKSGKTATCKVRVK